jgi:hypothetical protein
MCRVMVRIWGPAKGSELELATRAGEAEIEARACALRGLSDSLPCARVIESAVTREARIEDGRALPGYLVSLTIETRAPTWPGGGGVEWLQLWIESEVSVALLELLNPMVVDGVSVTG